MYVSGFFKNNIEIIKNEYFVHDEYKHTYKILLIYNLNYISINIRQFKTLTSQYEGIIVENINSNGVII